MMSTGVFIALIVLSFILFLSGLALTGIFLHEEIDKKKGVEIHIYYIIAGIILVILGLAGAIVLLKKRGNDSKIEVLTGSLAEKEDILTPDSYKNSTIGVRMATSVKTPRYSY